MKYFSLNTVLRAYDLVSSTTKDKFWGILGILYSIDYPVKPCINYSINTSKLSMFLENKFRLNRKKTYNISSNIYSVVFANNWEEKTSEYFLVGKPNIMPIIIWAYRNDSFQTELTANDLFEKFIIDFHLSKESLEKLFSINLNSIELEFHDILYNDNQLLIELGGKSASDITTIKMNKSFVIANAGDLSRGPFFQPLYTSLNTLECLIIFPFETSNYYDVFNSPIKHSSTVISYRKDSLQQIYYGAPGTGKSHIINKKVCGKSVIRTTFHPDSDYSTFVGCYKPTTKTVKMRDMAGHVIKENGEEVTEDRIVYEFVDQAFLQAYIKAWKFYATQNEEIKNQFLVIEEINRGNCAQIFGDLFQLLDRNQFGFSDYPIQADNDMRKQLAKAFKDINLSEENKNRINACYNGNKDYVSQVLDGEILLLPDNLYIWATMNTSDQSLFPIDSAFKRRWDWQYMPIAKGREEGKELNWSIEADTNRYDWWSFLTKINEQIGSTTNSEDKKLGFFFCKAVNEIINAETFVGKVIFYLWNDVFKDFGFENTIFNDEDGSTLSFDKFYSTNAEGKVVVNKDKVQRFLDNLGVIHSGKVEIDDDDLTLEELAKNSSDRTSYTINGNNVGGKCNVAFDAIKLYAQNHANYTPEQIVEEWKNLKIKHMPHLVETEEDHLKRKEKSSDLKFDDKSKRLEVNGKVLYISNQFNPERIAEFMSKVNNQNWDIKIETVE